LGLGAGGLRRFGLFGFDPYFQCIKLDLSLGQALGVFWRLE
jgi:hypothetical protein